MYRGLVGKILSRNRYFVAAHLVRNLIRGEDLLLPFVERLKYLETFHRLVQFQVLIGVYEEDEKLIRHDGTPYRRASLLNSPGTPR